MATSPPSTYDVASGQPYTELCRLIGDDTAMVPAEDGVDNNVSNGVLRNATLVFPNAAVINRSLDLIIEDDSLNEDPTAAEGGPTDEIRAGPA